MARKINKSIIRKEPVPTLIGAGITEQWYFTHLKLLQGLKVQIRPRFFGNEHIHALKKNVKQVLATDGRAIVVFDSDVTQWDEKERVRLDAFRKRYKDDDSVLLCESMPSIEFWFLLHYVSTSRYYGSSKNVIAELKKFIPQFDKKEGFLKHNKWVAELIQDGKMDKAMQQAEALGRSGASYSDVWKAFKALKLTSDGKLE